MVIRYFRDLTSISVPIVRDWGLTLEAIHKGQDLSDLLQQPTETKEDAIVQDPNIDNAKLDFVYEQIAGFMLELSRVEFPRIGAISQNATSGQRDVTRRPLTYDINEVVTLAPFNFVSHLFAARAQSFQVHLEAQRNIAGDGGNLAWNQFVARHYFARMVSTQDTVNETGPFRLFCNGLRPTNMLADSETLRISSVLDFEFTNAMPAQFADDVPWWLLLQKPAVWISEGKVQEFLTLLQPRKEQFIQAMERVECKSPLATEETMGTFDSTSHYGVISFDIDEIYWKVLHKGNLGEALLDSATLGEKEASVRRKKAQLDAYRSEKESDQRFAGQWWLVIRESTQ
ncbi:hypothetical protein CDEST_15433 [Colletotrichum destructivum]|uniref:Phosphotransferase enzyme family protein n=1 Tax=Colletotrichum destructivum TaxID=34406 RepID=A0AAX4J498_9PEZI|nr:hypothetical protein CDEST_15433 [Colletotrichum destructivum]